jgi:hypothetical protein
MRARATLITHTFLICARCARCSGSRAARTLILNEKCNRIGARNRSLHRSPYTQSRPSTARGPCRHLRPRHSISSCNVCDASKMRSDNLHVDNPQVRETRARALPIALTAARSVMCSPRAVEFVGGNRCPSSHANSSKISLRLSYLQSVCDKPSRRPRECASRTCASWGEWFSKQQLSASLARHARAPSQDRNRFFSASAWTDGPMKTDHLPARKNTATLLRGKSQTYNTPELTNVRTTILLYFQLLDICFQKGNPTEPKGT